MPNKDKGGQVTRAQMEEIAKIKMNDLNASDVDHAVEWSQARPQHGLGSQRLMQVSISVEAE